MKCFGIRKVKLRSFNIYLLRAMLGNLKTVARINPAKHLSKNFLHDCQARGCMTYAKVCPVAAHSGSRMFNGRSFLFTLSVILRPLVFFYLPMFLKRVGGLVVKVIKRPFSQR